MNSSRFAPGSSHRRIPLLLTPDHPCPYLPAQSARTAFVSPDVVMDMALYSALLQAGYRRSGQHVYRPHCARCQACLSLRVPVEQFQANRQQRRYLKRNADLQIAWAEPALTDEHWALYQRYIDTRHQDGDMYPASPEQFYGFLIADWAHSRILELRLDGALVGVAVIDVCADGYSAVYSFFAPELAQRSLGVYLVLSLLALARLEQRPFLYLGFYIEACRKMQYKANYQPAQIWRNGHWQAQDRVSKRPDNAS